MEKLEWFSHGLGQVRVGRFRPRVLGRWLVVVSIWVWALYQLGKTVDLQQGRSSPGTPTTAASSSPPSPETQGTAAAWARASFPVENFTRYTSPFGYRQHPYGGYRFHYGLDMAAPMGSYIRNWWDGTITEVSDHTTCGTSVIIQSQDWTHIYCHMQGHVVWEQDGDRVLVDRDGGIKLVQGNKIKSGERIGRIGMTGRTTGPHLHWGMKYQGRWIDPALIIEAMVATDS